MPRLMQGLEAGDLGVVDPCQVPPARAWCCTGVNDRVKVLIERYAKFLLTQQTPQVLFQMCLIEE